jgi:outer membrane cobalamin receptor
MIKLKQLFMFLFRSICAVAGALLCAGAWAQYATDSAMPIREVTVVANRYREVIPSQRLSGQRLEALGSFSVADAVRYFSGVQIKDYGGIGGLKTVDVRSMGTNHTAVFYDGIQVGNAQNGQTDLGKFSMDNIEEISLYNGQKSEIFQAAKDFATASAMYMRTRRPQFPEGKRRNLKASFRTGSFDLLNPSLCYERQLSRQLSAALSAEYVNASGRYKYRYRKVLRTGQPAWDTTAVRQNGDIRSFRAEGGLYGFVEQGKWQAKSYFYHSEKGIPGAIVSNVWKHAQRQWDRNFFTQGAFQKHVSDRYEMQVGMKYANDWLRYLNPDSTLMHIDNVFLQQEFYISTAHRYALRPDWDVNLSIDYQYNALTARFADPRRSTLWAALATAGEWKRLKAQANVLATFVFESVAHATGRREYTPAVFLSYRPFEQHNFNLRTFYKRIFRMPTFNDLYYTDFGNINLRPEFAAQYNLGFQYLLPALQIRADAYYNKVSDKIVAIPKGSGQYRWMVMNLGAVVIRGLELSVQSIRKLPFDTEINAGLNYTFQRAQDFSDRKSVAYGGQIAYIPRHSGSLIVAAKRQTWDLNYSFIYTGERYHTSENIPANYEPAWYTHDMTLGKTFRCRNMKCKLSAELNNILNQHYDAVLNYPMPGRNCRFILKLEI